MKNIIIVFLSICLILSCPGCCMGSGPSVNKIDLPHTTSGYSTFNPIPLKVTSINEVQYKDMQNTYAVYIFENELGDRMKSNRLTVIDTIGKYKIGDIVDLVVRK